MVRAMHHTIEGTRLARRGEVLVPPWGQKRCVDRAPNPVRVQVRRQLLTTPLHRPPSPPDEAMDRSEVQATL